jgi:hypothetical protein
MFDDLEFEDSVSDIFHLFLRITDLLFDLFILSLTGADNVNEKAIYNPKNQPHFRTFIYFLQNDCKIGIKTHSITITQINQFMNRLTGNQRFLILKKQKLVQLYMSVDYENKLENLNVVAKIWDDFYNIIMGLKQNTSPNPESVETSCHSWLLLFLTIYSKIHCTPLVHIFVNHLHYMYALHKEANYFNLQGLEKSNHVVKMIYQRSTNKRDQPLKQALQKLCRIDFLKTLLN